MPPRDGDSFQVLAAHHGAQAHPGGGKGAIGDDAGVADEALAGRPDRGDVAAAPQARLERIDDLRCVESPQVAGGNERGLPFDEGQDHGLLRATGRNDRGKRGLLEGNPKWALRAGLADSTGEG